MQIYLRFKTAKQSTFREVDVLDLSKLFKHKKLTVQKVKLSKLCKDLTSRKVKA